MKKAVCYFDCEERSILAKAVDSLGQTVLLLVVPYGSTLYHRAARGLRQARLWLGGTQTPATARHAWVDYEHPW